MAFVAAPIANHGYPLPESGCILAGNDDEHWQSIFYRLTHVQKNDRTPVWNLGTGHVKYSADYYSSSAPLPVPPISLPPSPALEKPPNVVDVVETPVPALVDAMDIDDDMERAALAKAKRPPPPRAAVVNLRRSQRKPVQSTRYSSAEFIAGI